MTTLGYNVNVYKGYKDKSHSRNGILHHNTQWEALNESRNIFDSLYSPGIDGRS